MALDPHALTVAIRWLHVAAMAVATGGASLLVALSLSRPSHVRGSPLVAAAVTYERIFWGAAGVLVMTGVGNLAVLGAQLPSRGSEWGVTLLAKLALVVLLMLASVPRTLVIAHAAADSDHEGAPADDLIARMYIGTLFGLGAILILALWLSHG